MLNNHNRKAHIPLAQKKLKIKHVPPSLYSFEQMFDKYSKMRVDLDSLIISDLYRDEFVWASIGMSLWKISGPATLGSHGWNGMGLTRGAAVNTNNNTVCVPCIISWELIIFKRIIISSLHNQTTLLIIMLHPSITQGTSMVWLKTQSVSSWLLHLSVVSYLNLLY